MNTPVKIVIADQHDCSLLGLQTFLLSSSIGAEVVGLAHNEPELLQMAESLAPDVIITEIKAPVLNGIESTKHLMQKYPHVCLIAFTAREEIYMIHQLVSAGIHACVSKNGSMDELLHAIQSVSGGENYYCPATQQKLEQFSKEGCLLNQIQLEILHHFSEDKTDHEIGEMLFKSHRTIEHQREKIKEKLKVKSNIALMNAALAKGYVVRIFTGMVIHLSFFDETVMGLVA
jgi:DNA-binding NarL/FixJ family response regulator